MKMEVNKETRLGISKNVFVMGLVSFFNDVASEMLYPIVPIFLTSILGAPVSIVGLVEGIAESTASILKVISGWYSDKYQKRIHFIVTGYSLSSISKIILGFAFAWPMVLLGRFIDRFGKGIRTSARDALIAESSTCANRGKSFGFHRALDTAGAVVGPLLAIWLLNSYSNNFRTIFFMAFIPAFIGVLLLLFFVKERKKEPLGINLKLKGSWNELNMSFKIFLAISILFAIGNSSDVFLILRSQNLGLSVTATILAYVVFNFAYALFSVPAGVISDRIGARKVLISGFLLFGIVYLLFGIVTHNYWLWLIFPLYGIYMALTEGVSKAYISNLVPQEKTGSAFGLYQTAIGICTFFASLIAGLLWDKISVSAPFILGSFTAFISAILFLFWGKWSVKDNYFKKGVAK
jgi:MFS family permease